MEFGSEYDDEPPEQQEQPQEIEGFPRELPATPPPREPERYGDDLWITAPSCFTGEGRTEPNPEEYLPHTESAAPPEVTDHPPPQETARSPEHGMRELRWDLGESVFEAVTWSVITNAADTWAPGTGKVIQGIRIAAGVIDAYLSRSGAVAFQ